MIKTVEMKKEKPILFSTPIDGRKTQTRRVVIPQPKYIIRHNDGSYSDLDRYITKRPRYDVGDILWVRETYAPVITGEYIYKADRIFDGCEKGDISWNWKPSIHMPREAARLFLEVKSVRVERLQDISEKDAKLEGIRRKYEGCQAERNRLPGPLPGNCPAGCSCLNHRELYFDYWDSLNAKRGYSWESNPWVWVYDFMRVEK